LEKAAKGDIIGMFCPHRPTFGANARLIGLDRRDGERTKGIKISRKRAVRLKEARRPFFLRRVARWAGEGQKPRERNET